MERYDQVFNASYRRILGDGAYHPGFMQSFYTHFFASSPQIAERFANTDMSRQKTMLHDSLTTLVDFSAHKQLSAQMQRLGRVHGKDAADIPPRLYELWLTSLLEAVREFDHNYSIEVEMAWRLTLAPGISYLQFAYAHPSALQ